MRKWLCLLLAILFISLFASCASKQTNSAQDASATPTEPFVSVLNSKQTFYSVNRNADMLLADYHKSVWRFSAEDIDGDDNLEIAVMFQDGNILILRQNHTSVYGYDFGLHAMYQINTDGSFFWNRDAGNCYGCAKLQFTADGQYETIELWRAETDKVGAVTYYVDGKPVSKEFFESTTTQKSQKSIVWNPWENVS